uniref:Mediator complex subunit 15 n=1 Tax=Acrobeloides nanus TaxID=290746 RepID=A0A914C7J8_9BILA
MNYNEQQQQYMMHQQRMEQQRMMMQQQQQQQMRPQSMQYTIQQPGPHMSMSAPQINEFIKTLPREAQMNINNEKDKARKAYLVNEYYKRRQMEQQSMQTNQPQYQPNPQVRMMPSGQMGGGQIMYMGQQPMPNQPQPIMTGQMPIQRGQQPYTGQPMSGPMQPAHGQQQPSRFPTGQQMPPHMQPQPMPMQPTQAQPPPPVSATMPSAQLPQQSAVAAQPNQNSPMPAAVSAAPQYTGPATPSGRSVTSTGSAGTTKSSIDVNAPEYRETLNSLKKYHPQCLRLLDRVRLDGHIELEKTIQRIIEIMEGKRNVERKLVEKLIRNIEVTLAKQSPMRGLTEFVKRLSHIPELGSMHGILPDPWAEVRHLQIKVPDEMLNTIREKRKFGTDVYENCHSSPTKRAKFEERVLSERKISKNDGDPIQVQCLNGRVVSLSKSASDELKRAGYRIDPDLAPISEHDPLVTILVDHSPNNHFNPIQPLRLLVPKDYPEGNPLQFFCESHDHLKRMKIHSNPAHKHSILEIVSAYRNVV